MKKWGTIMEIAIAFLILCALLFDPIFLGNPSYRQNHCFNFIHTFGHSIFAYVPHTMLGAAKIHSHKYLNSDKQATVNRRTKKSTKISIFEGRGADRNLSIFHILVAVGPLSIGDIQRRLNRTTGLEVTYYASLNKRIHALVQGGYVGEVKSENAGQAGFKVTLYDVRMKFYLAYYLNGKSREEILSKLNEPNATIILSDLINAEITEA